MKFDFNAFDRRIAALMQRWGTTALQVSLAVIFIWFGILKPFGLSAAEPLVKPTVAWLPLFSPDTWLAVIGWWEVAIGVTFLFRKTVRLAIAMLALQMVGTFMPLVLLPDVTFQSRRIPYAPTMEGQYIIKNLLIISAALVVGGTVRQRTRSAAD
ncbi:MAG: YkgB family protein [Gemmataceae bacterium]|nr:YkgB family protein [Gemmataceae bacterium]